MGNNVDSLSSIGIVLITFSTEKQSTPPALPWCGAAEMHVPIPFPSPLFLSDLASFPLTVEPPRYQTCVVGHDHIRHQAHNDGGDDKITHNQRPEDGHGLK